MDTPHKRDNDNDNDDNDNNNNNIEFLLCKLKHKLHMIKKSMSSLKMANS